MRSSSTATADGARSDAGDESDVVLVVGSGTRAYREYLLAGASERRPVWLLDGAPPTWQERYATRTSVIPLVDSVRLIPDRDRLVEEAAALAGRQRVVGVFTYDETLVMTAAHIADRLGLPGLGVEGADRCRNKHRCRQMLTAAGLPQPRFALAWTLHEAAVAAERIGYPVVLKPRGMGASIGVVRARTAGDLEAAYTVAERASHRGAPAYEGGVLVEEFVAAPEISVDGAVFAGEYRPIFLARKRVGLAPFFEEVGHTVDSEDPLLGDDELNRVLVEAHRVLGLGNGMTHTEVLLADRGPMIVEINARLGGDLIPYLGKLVTGIDPGGVAVDLATATPPDLTPSRRGCVGIRFLYPPVDCRVRSVSMPAPGSAPGLIEARAIAEAGKELRLPPRAHLGRFGYLICEGPDATSCDARLEAAAPLVQLDFDGIVDGS